MILYPGGRQSHLIHVVTGNDIVCNKVSVYFTGLSAKSQSQSIALERAFCVMQRLYNLLEGATV